MHNPFIFPYFGMLIPGLYWSPTGSAACLQIEKQAIEQPSVDVDSRFGQSIIMRGNELFIGQSRGVFSFFEAGLVHYYTRVDEDSAFTYDQEITAASPGIGHAFGTGIGFDGTTLVSGSDNPVAGQVEFFTLQTGVWTSDQLVLPNTFTVGGSRFGQECALDGVHALIAAPEAPNGGSIRGGVEYWENVAGTWTFRQAISSNTPTDGNHFGQGVAMASDSVAYIASVNSASNTLVERFTRSGTTWTYDSEFNIAFGSGSVSIDTLSMDSDGVNLSYGYSRHDADVNNEGMVLVTNQAGATLLQLDGTVLEDEFGTGTSIQGNEMAIGSSLADDSVPTARAGIAAIWDICF